MQGLSFRSRFSFIYINTAPSFLHCRTKAWANPAAEAEERIAEADRRYAACARELAAERAARVEDVQRAQRRIAECERRAETLAEEGASLVLELEARPSVREAKSLQRQARFREMNSERYTSNREHGCFSSLTLLRFIKQLLFFPSPIGLGQVEILERKLAALRQGGEAGATAEAAEVALGAAAASRGATEALPLRDRIRRDREVHRLGLRHVEQLPRDVLVDLVQARRSADF